MSRTIYSNHARSPQWLQNSNCPLTLLRYRPRMRYGPVIGGEQRTFARIIRSCRESGLCAPSQPLTQLARTALTGPWPMVCHAATRPVIPDLGGWRSIFSLAMTVERDFADTHKGRKCSQPPSLLDGLCATIIRLPIPAPLQNLELNREQALPFNAHGLRDRTRNPVFVDKRSI